MSCSSFFSCFFYSHSRTSKNHPEPHFGTRILKKTSKTLPKWTPGDLKNNIFPDSWNSSFRCHSQLELLFLLVHVLQVRFKTLQKNTWGRTPDKNGPDIALLQLFPENVPKWVPGRGPGEGPRTTFSQPFSLLSPTGSPGGPWVAQMLPKGSKTMPRDCQNEAPGLPKRSRMCHRPHHFLTWALPQGYEIRIEGTVAGTPQANRYYKYH